MRGSFSSYNNAAIQALRFCEPSYSKGMRISVTCGPNLRIDAAASMACIGSSRFARYVEISDRINVGDDVFTPALITSSFPACGSGEEPRSARSWARRVFSVSRRIILELKLLFQILFRQSFRKALYLAV